MQTQRIQFFPSSSVRVRDRDFANAMRNNRDYLLRLEPDRLLALFRREAGLLPRAEVYGGWESRGVAGHTLGHYLSALSLMFGATGEAVLKERAAYIVDELVECQNANGDGYIGATPDGKAIYGRIARGEIEAKDPFNLGGGWVPIYTLHKIFAGLLDAYRLCEIELAREAVIGLTDWCDGIFGHLSHQQMQTVLFVEHGGMAESLAEVWSISGAARHLELARKFRHDAFFEPALRGEDSLDGRHANTQIPKFIGYQRIGELTGESDWKRAARNFWEFVARHRSFVIGGNSVNEHFFPTDQFEAAMHAGVGPETCNTYNLLKLTRQLWAETPDAALMDFTERALWNHILASQHPQSGAFVYHSGVRPGSYRTYSTETESFWCCVGTGIENPGKYGESIYARSGDTLFVNLFLDSQLEWAEQGAVISQETRFPTEERTLLHFQLDAPREFCVAVRYPSWVEAGALKIVINGENWSVEAPPGEYLFLKRRWENGDQVKIELPMRVSTEILPGNAGYAAITYGPIVLAAKLGDEGLSDADWVASNLPREALLLPFEKQPAITVPLAQVAEKVRRVPGQALIFETNALFQPDDVTLVPFYQLHEERYSLYFPVLENEAAWQNRQREREAAAAREAEIARRVVDEVQPGEQQPELDHQISGENTRSGRKNERGWRAAEADGWFSYRLKVAPDAPMLLGCTYWGGDAGREFDLFVDETFLATQKLDGQQGAQFFEVIHSLSPALTQGKQSVVLKWQPKAGSVAGGLFGCRTLRQSQTDSSNVSSTVAG